MPSALADHYKFLRGLIARPKNVGAIAPSSPALARAMAAQISVHADASVLELGPGTGVVTEALIARGIAPKNITSIEYDPEFAAMVSARCPGVRVIRGDAFDLAKTLVGCFGGPFAAVISSLPLINFPHAMRNALLADIFARLEPGAPFIQFSYRLHCPVVPPVGASVTRAAVIWLNLPPARVWVYRKTSALV
jgi:phosphatidylethanolamine/phosphatidyl-N-methylethanolamine N-methyltransferase